MKALTPCVMWNPDCQGKWDYDGRLISVSTRYWPGGRGFDVYDSAHPELGLHPLIDPSIKPSANAAIVLNHGKPDEFDGFGDYVTLISKDFEGNTEAEVKAQVEGWVNEQFIDLARLLLRRYGVLNPV
jgi:hypothetical protein